MARRVIDQPAFRDEPKRRFSRFPTLKESVIAVALALSVAFSPFKAAAQPTSAPARASVTSAVDWKKTHLAIINGDEEPRHRKNALMAAETGMRHKAAKVHVAGLADRLKGILRYRANKKGISRMLHNLGNDMKSDEIVFVYVTGHGLKNSFVLEKKEKARHKDFLRLMEKHLSGKKVVFASDACFSANFVNLIINSKKFKKISALSPGLKDEQTSCGYFAQPFWHALSDNLDLDGNKFATLQEAFQYGLKKYRKFPETYSITAA